MTKRMGAPPNDNASDMPTENHYSRKSAKWCFTAIIACLGFTSISPAQARDTIRGVVTDSHGKPLPGMRVKAVDSDPFGEEKMGVNLTNKKGEYVIKYSHKHWDECGYPWEARNPCRRPDIRLYVSRYQPGGFKRKDQSPVFKDWVMKKDLVYNFKIEEGTCPYPAVFNTTGVWRGCSCPTGTSKRWRDVLKNYAHCIEGDNPKKRCEKKKAYEWVGVNNSQGYCVKPMNAVALHRQGYYEYFKHVRRGIVGKMERLPAWVINRYDRHFPNVSLRDIVIGESRNTPSETTVITDCKKIYYPAALNELQRIRSGSGLNYFLLLHEIAHADQCMAQATGNGSTKRDRYADMYISQWPESFFETLLNDGFPLPNSLHDNIPMEKEADRKAIAVIKATGVGADTIPVRHCPTGEFSTRDHRGCKCPSGTRKRYSGVFKESARCNQVGSTSWPGRGAARRTPRPIPHLK